MATKYATLAEASEAAQRLEFKTQPEYKRDYKQDPKLPANPNQLYAGDWDDWYSFLGTEHPVRSTPLSPRRPRPLNAWDSK